MTGRRKKVMEHHIRSQHASLGSWPTIYRIDNDELTPAQTLERVKAVLESAGLE
ncbi:hypothetical protein ACFLW0_06250 [Chloroflexota bacterium]